MLILYGSQTGNAQDAAERVAREATNRGFRVRALPANYYLDMIDQFPQEELVLFVVSTTGQGDFPTNCSLFWKFLRRKSLGPDLLSNVKVAVFGLGDSGYLKYNYTGKLLYRRFATLGAKLVLPLGLGDDQHKYGYDAALDPWLESLWVTLGVGDTMSDSGQAQLKPKFRVVTTRSSSSCNIGESGTASSKDNTERNVSNYQESVIVGRKFASLEEAEWKSDISMDLSQGSICKAAVMRNERVTSPDHFQDVRHVGIDIQHTGIEFRPGDSIAIYPRQSDESIQCILNRLGLSRDDEVAVSLYSRDHKRTTSELKTTAGTLIAGAIDVEGAPPRRTFFEALSQLCPDGMYKERLSHLGSAKGREDLNEYVTQEGRNIIDVLEDFSCVPITLEWLLSFAPRLKPRYYSAASSLSWNSGVVELLIALVEWKTPGRRLRKGLCSRFISSLAPGDDIMIEVSPGTIHPPPPEVPMILIGPGTGVAPFRSFLQERDSLARQCEASIAPSTLFFGCRYRSKDFFFASEWDSMLQSHALGGPAGGLVVASSRDLPNNKVYVTHKMKEHAAGIWEAISQGASIFVAGRADKMPNDVEQALLDIIVQEGQLDMSEAKKYLRRMEATARYQMECWS